MEKPDFDKKLFWDVGYEKSDLDRSAQFIIVRIFERGSISDVKKLRAWYGDKKIKEEIKKAKWIEPETLQFLSAIYNISLNKFRCYTEKQLRSQLSIY
jgi:hypothetical protein